MKQLIWCTLCLRWSRTVWRLPMWWQRWMLFGLQPVRTTPATQCNSFITDIHHNNSGNTTRLDTCASSSAGKEFWFLGILPWQTTGEWWSLWLSVTFYGESFLSKEDHRPLCSQNLISVVDNNEKKKMYYFHQHSNSLRNGMFALKS